MHENSSVTFTYDVDRYNYYIITYNSTEQCLCVVKQPVKFQQHTHTQSVYLTCCQQCQKPWTLRSKEFLQYSGLFLFGYTSLFVCCFCDKYL